MLPLDFTGPRKTARWAREEINNFETAEEAFIKASPPEESSHFDPLTNERVVKLIFSAHASDELERGAYRIVIDLRNALDQAVNAASRALNSTKPNMTNFPVGDDEAGFWGQLRAPKGKYAGIPVELHDILGSFEPFWRKPSASKGNNLLRALAAVANPNKHQIPLAIAVSRDVAIRTLIGVNSFESKWEGNAQTMVFRGTPGVPYQINVSLPSRVSFGPGVEALGSRPALATFQEFQAIVDAIIDKLEAETARLIGA